MGYAFSKSGNITSPSENISILVTGTRTTQTAYEYAHFYTSANGGSLRYKGFGSFSASGSISQNLGFTCYYGRQYTIDLYVLHTHSASPPSNDPSILQTSTTITVWPSEEKIIMKVSEITPTSVSVRLTASSSRDYYDRTYAIYKDSSFVGTITIPKGSFSGNVELEVTSGITPGVLYTYTASYITNSYSTGSATMVYKTSVPYAATDSGSYSYTAGFTNVKLELTYITARDYERCVYYYWENTSTGASGKSFKLLDPGDTSSYRDMPNLSKGTQYKFRIYVENPDYVITYDTGYFYVTTLDYNYTIALRSFATSSTIGVTITLNSAQAYDTSFILTLDGGRSTTATIPAGSITKTYTWISSITPATAYTIGVADTLRDKSYSLSKRTKNNFSWSTPVVSGAVFDLKASDWNEFTSQLASKAAYYGVSYNPATVNKGDTLTAEKFNNIAAVINKLVDGQKGDCVTKVSSVSKGDPVRANTLQKIRDCLNE